MSTRRDKDQGRYNRLPNCAGLLTAGPDLTEPEIWFRIAHITPELRDVRQEATDREQTVEIALGPKGTFENGHIGTLTRRVPADRVLSAVPPWRGKPKQPQEPKTPRVAELLRKAIEWRALLTSGEVSTQAAIGRREGVTRVRVTQILGLLRLAPEIQRHILSMPKTVGCPMISERVLRSITMFDDQQQQLQAFADILSK